MKILVTGSSGFIGFHLCLKLLKNSKYKIFGIDNMNNYYDVNLKNSRNKILRKSKNFKFKKIDISNFNSINNYFKLNRFDVVINLAAQAGVRFSIENPGEYFKSNITGFFNIIECSRIFKIKHLIYASTSSVYGDSKKFPVKENFNTDNPLSFYAATKKSNEVLAYSYSNIYKLPSTALRFFTVYGNYGRPDMSLFKFVKNILSRKKIDLYNNGNHSRDFTHVTDIANIIDNLIQKPPQGKVPHDIFNISGNRSVTLSKFIKIIEDELKIKSKKNLLPMQKADVLKSSANINKILKKTKLSPSVTLEQGIKSFVKWYRDFYQK